MSILNARYLIELALSQQRKINSSQHSDFIGVGDQVEEIIINKKQIPHCRLLGDFGWKLQCILGALCFSVLLYKRYRERPRRPQLIFFYDAMKQGLGSLTLHFFNVVASVVQSSSVLTSPPQDPCTWYFINIIIDTTLGVVVTFLLLKSFPFFLSTSVPYRHLEFGYYGDPPLFTTFLIQAGIWQIIVTLMKAFMVLLMFLFKTPLYSVTSGLLYPFELYPKVKLVIVMILVPSLMNAFQYWVTDNILMRKSTTKHKCDKMKDASP